MYLAETETNEIKKIVQIRVYLTGKDQAAAQSWQQILILWGYREGICVLFTGLVESVGASLLLLLLLLSWSLSPLSAREVEGCRKRIFDERPVRTPASSSLVPPV